MVTNKHKSVAKIPHNAQTQDRQARAVGFREKLFMTGQKIKYRLDHPRFLEDGPPAVGNTERSYKDGRT
jgi:hypothetical protein